jgi:hypothetical protein
VPTKPGEQDHARLRSTHPKAPDDFTVFTCPHAHDSRLAPDQHISRITEEHACTSNLRLS